jgi:hypothetical protein
LPSFNQAFAPPSHALRFFVQIGCASPHPPLRTFFHSSPIRERDCDGFYDPLINVSFVNITTALPLSFASQKLAFGIAGLCRREH